MSWYNFPMRSFVTKTVIYTASAGVILVGTLFGAYKWALPSFVSSEAFSNFVSEQVKKNFGADLTLKGVNLKTGKEIAFTVDELRLDKGKEKLLELSKIDTLFSLETLLGGKITVKKMLAESIYADVGDLMELAPKEEKKKKKSSKNVLDFYNVLLGVKKCDIKYNKEDLAIDFQARHMIFDRTQEKKYLHFDFDFGMKKNNHTISVSADDMNRFYMVRGAAYVVDFPVYIENSKIIINAHMTRKGKYELTVKGENFSAADVAEIVNSNTIVANGSELLAPIKDITGRVNFNVRLDNGKFSGNINVGEVNFKIIPLIDMPVKVTKGFVDIGTKDIEYKDFEGYYNNKKTNILKMKGTTKDYQKTCDTKLFSDIYVTDDFFKNYLSKMLNTQVNLVGESVSKLLIKSKNGSCDILWFFKLDEGEGFKFGDQSMVLQKYKTLFKVDLSVVKNILKINTINYYITNELKRGIKPIITMNGDVDMADNMKFLDLNLDIPNPLPSEFLNFLLGHRIFKKGEISGKMSFDNRGKYPYMTGECALDKVFIPAERMYIKSGKLIAKGDYIDVKSEGGFRRSQYKFNGKINNNLTLPIVVKDVNLTVDNVDVERILTQPKPEDREGNVYTALISTGADNEENQEPQPFQKGLIVIEKCGLNVEKGVYKEINFGNLHANMTLDKDGVLKLRSNRFDIADGISTLRINADLAKQNYYMKLGIRDVDSNIMASAILGLPRQISGKAKGLIELTADETLKLNGDIKFKIANGTIEQVGYVEYILKVASLFRNPLAMISPSTVVDLVNIPEGRFDEISGEMKLKDNIINRMKIESTAPELATLIFGRYDLSTNDASMRVYTKFSNKGKGFAGILRNFSLNTLANKISISSRNDSNYYASELEQIPKLQTGEESAQVFLTKVDGDILNFNFLSSLKRIK